MEKLKMPQDEKRNERGNAMVFVSGRIAQTLTAQTNITRVRMRGVENRGGSVTVVVLLLFLTQWQGAKSGSNATQGAIEDEDEADAAFENMNLAEFKERYRRLIPYMTYYVANNYVNPQVLDAAQQQQQSPSYERENALAMSPLIRKPQRLVSVGRPTDPRRKPNRHRATNAASGTLHKQEDKFVPSVQYDPKGIGGDSNYFTPVRYNPKLNYDTVEYSDDRVPSRHREYDGQQQGPLVYAVASSPAPLSLHKDTRYYVKDRPPAGSYNPLYERPYSSPTQNSPRPSVHQDYLLDYGSRTTSNKSPVASSDYGYPSDDYESVRYVNIEPPQRNHQKPTRILAQSVSRRPLLPSVSPIYSTRHSAATLQDIMKSLQLTNRLPEMLNKDNVDSSINTLVEILRILNKAKETDFLRSQVQAVPNDPYRHVPSRDDFKQVYTRPKVVTETRFQATPSPPVVASEQTLRYKPEASYETNVQANGPPNVDAEIVNNPKHHNVIEYYTPLIQDIDEEKIDTYRPVKIPERINEESEHTYEIPEDLAGEIHEKEKYVLPITTETPISKFQLPDGVSTHSQLVPPTTLKYGATRGKPNVDYPAHAAIPETEFNCKEQRYKGFFGDPSTGCQVWHYCDLNGGKSSFLCPNGTIFSQVALTCDWWFNVKCESTPQLYVLNERLYKYILPVMPKFPEDFSGPEVDRYLELKFKEMEAKLKEKKLKKQQAANKNKEKLQAHDNEE